jgi:hypothetical protein
MAFPSLDETVKVETATSRETEMPYFRPPNCPYCRNHPLMSRKGFYKRGDPEPLYGMVPITSDGEVIDGRPPTPLRVFQCNSCGVLALFPEDQERDAGLNHKELGGNGAFSPAEQILREQQRLRVQQEATASRAEQIVREKQRLEQQAQRK